MIDKDWVLASRIKQLLKTAFEVEVESHIADEVFIDKPTVETATTRN